ncbi:MAG: YXWGXW repeat-containing protein, partial [Caulobacteraceae bacterium]|nr:YXWGXW repeat-containing protein [Caulobacteraceae bacterium]
MATRKWIGASAALALVFGAGVMTVPAAHAQEFGIEFSVYADTPPPPIPVYEQPPIPEPGYIWVPGYWAWDDDYGDYYWVPGTWVLPPEPGLLWTPGYWGWTDGGYGFIPGYWGVEVGFYGGVDYGYGYTGHGYEGGYWRGRTFYYNSVVNNVRNVNITNVYERPVQASTGPRVGFNGGPGGVQARPTPQELSLARQPHRPPTQVQAQQSSMARQQPELRASANQGRPPIAATQRPQQFQGPGVASATRAGGAYRAPPPQARPGGRPPGAGNRQSEPAAQPYRGPAGEGYAQPYRGSQAQPYRQPQPSGQPYRGSEAQPYRQSPQSEAQPYRGPEGQGYRQPPQPSAQPYRGYEAQPYRQPAQPEAQPYRGPEAQPYRGAEGQAYRPAQPNPGQQPRP